LEYVGSSAPAGKPPMPNGAAGADDDDMPPLEYVGVTSSAADSRVHAVIAAPELDEDEDLPPLEDEEAVKTMPQHSSALPESDDDMPPLEHVGQPLASAESASAAKQRTPLPAKHSATAAAAENTLRAGDKVLLKGLPRPDLNGLKGTIEAIKGNDNTVKLDVSGQQMVVKSENLHKIWLRGSGAGSMPPLQYVGAHVSSQHAPGDLVVLRDMKIASLNGEKAKVLEAGEAERIQVELLRTGQRLNVGRPNAQKSTEKAATESKTCPGDQSTPSATQAEDVLQKLKFAMQTSILAEVDEALAAAEAAQGLDWGELLLKKKQLMKKLRAKRKKMTEGDEPCTKKAAELPGTSVSMPKAKSIIAQWCEDLQLPEEMVERLVAEDVTDPQELTGVGEDELASLTVGLKIGPKGRFMKAVSRLKAQERAELGSVVGSTC